MKLEIRLEEDCAEPRLILVTNRMTEELRELCQRLSGEQAMTLVGFRAGSAVLLEEDEIYRIYASDGRVFAVTAQGEYQLRQRLYALEERLDSSCFVRISHSEIINLRRVREFDLRLTGTICVWFVDGSRTYVSRRYVTKIKQVLGI